MVRGVAGKILAKRRAHVLGGGALVHAVERQSMANERDDAVLMTWSPQGRE